MTRRVFTRNLTLSEAIHLVEQRQAFEAEITIMDEHLPHRMRLTRYHGMWYVDGAEMYHVNPSIPMIWISANTKWLLRVRCEKILGETVVHEEAGVINP